ncbi:MAG: response regulator [Bacteroides sp.]
MTNKRGNIIVVDDNPGVLMALQLLLKPIYNKVKLLAKPDLLPATLGKEEWEVVLLDMNFSSGLNTGQEGIYWLHQVKRLAPSLPVVLITAFADIALAVKGMKEGASDFIVKPWDNHQLLATLRRAADFPTPSNQPYPEEQLANIHAQLSGSASADTHTPLSPSPHSSAPPHPSMSDMPSPKAVTLEEMEEQMVRQAISKSQGNLSAAAQQLGISRQTLYNKMKKYGI